MVHLVDGSEPPLEALLASSRALTANISAAVQVEAQARATQTGELYAQYTVKTDVAGLVSGYGLASTANNAAPSSAFGVQANRFFIAPPAVVSATPPTTNLFNGFVWLDTNFAPPVTRYWDATNSVWTTAPQTLPFVVQTTPTFINGMQIEPGVYMDTAYMRTFVAQRGQIGNLAVDDAAIANLSVSKLTAGTLAFGEYMQSTGYVPGSLGLRFNGDGTAELSQAVVRGTIFAAQGLIGGWTIGANYLQSNTYALGTSGTRLNADGTGQIGGVTIYAQGLGAGSSAFNTGPGVWLGRDGRFSLRNAAGTRYLTWDTATLNFSGNLVGASGTFSGSLQAATGSFSGTLSSASGLFSVDANGRMTAIEANIQRRAVIASGLVSVGVTINGYYNVNDDSGSYQAYHPAGTLLTSGTSVVIDTGINDSFLTNLSFSQPYQVLIYPEGAASYNLGNGFFDIFGRADVVVNRAYSPGGASTQNDNRVFIRISEVGARAVNAPFFTLTLPNFRWKLFRV
jgi:hypothetical protein